MKKFIIIPGIVIILLIITWLIIDSHRIKTRQSAEIKREFAMDSAFAKDDLADLPLLYYKSPQSQTDYFIIMISGDGGWRDFIDTLSASLAKKGIPVVGFNTIPYFSDTKSPAQIARDLERVIKNFSHAWKKQKVILGGYSFGAEILPFVYNKMDTAFQKNVEKVMMIAPSNLADFKVSPVYYYNPAYSKPVLPELNKVPPDKVLVFCDKYKHSICKVLPDKVPYEVVRVKYGHMFSKKYDQMSDVVANRLGVK